MKEEIKQKDDRFPSEKAGMPVFKEAKTIDNEIPFHKHTGTDGSPRVKHSELEITTP